MNEVLIMDSNVFFQKNFFDDNSTFETIKFICDSNNIDIKFPQIVADEVDKLYWQDISSLQEEHNKLISKIKKRDPDFVTKDNIYQRFSGIGMNYLMFLLQKHGLDYREVILYKNLNIENVMQRHFHDRYFEKNIKHFHDLLLWMIMETLEYDMIHFISNDKIIYKEEMIYLYLN